MYQDILRHIDGIGIFPVFSLVLFFTVFTLVVLYAWRLDRAGVRHLAALPLDDPGDGKEGSR
jgi:hypothetical protein